MTYALTGSLSVAGAVTFVERPANTVLQHFFGKYWDRPRARAWRARGAGLQPA